METLKVKVLSIGDKSKNLSNPKATPKYDPCNFREDAAKRTGKLLLGDENATWDMNFIGQDVRMDSYPIDGETRQYKFGIEKGRLCDNFYGHSVNAKNILREVKAKLSHEKWISEDIMEMKIKKGDCHDKTNNYVWDAVFKSWEEQDRKIIKYLCYLNQQDRLK